MAINQPKQRTLQHTHGTCCSLTIAALSLKRAKQHTALIKLHRSMKLYFSLFLAAEMFACSRAFSPAARISAQQLLRQQRTRTLTNVKATVEETVVDTEKPHEDAYDKVSMDDIVSLCKRRGFIFPSSEIYNGMAGFYDYGPLGVELKKNIKDTWWKSFVTSREDVVGLDSSIIHNPTTWQSSGKKSVSLTTTNY